jgi:hypothetical protein
VILQSLPLPTEKSREFIGPRLVHGVPPSGRFEGRTFDEERKKLTDQYLRQWSYSRAEALCARQSWFFQGPGSYAADHPEADILTKFIFHQRKLANLSLVVGGMVHNIIAHTLFAFRDHERGSLGDPKDDIHAEILSVVREGKAEPERLVQVSLERFRQYEEASLRNAEAFSHTHRVFRYFEHEYGNRRSVEETTDDFAAHHKKLENSIRSFFRDIYPKIAIERQIPPSMWADVERDEDSEIRSVPTFPLIFNEKKYDIYAGIDFSYFSKNGVLVIIDWKTGKLVRSSRDPHELDFYKKKAHLYQAGVYALYALQNPEWKDRRLSADKIKAHFVYTSEDLAVPPELRGFTLTYTQRELDSFLTDIGKSIERIDKSFQKDESGRYTLKMEDFSTHWETSPRMSDVGKIKICRRCPYAAACDKAPPLFRDPPSSLKILQEKKVVDATLENGRLPSLDVL